MGVLDYALTEAEIAVIEENPELTYFPPPAGLGDHGYIKYPSFDTQDAVRGKLQELCDWYNAAVRDPEHDPYEVAAMLQHRFVSIHPWQYDYSGRTSRLLMNWSLESSGLWPAVIEDYDRDLFTRPEDWVRFVQEGSERYGKRIARIRQRGSAADLAAMFGPQQEMTSDQDLTAGSAPNGPAHEENHPPHRHAAEGTAGARAVLANARFVFMGLDGQVTDLFHFLPGARIAERLRQVWRESGISLPEDVVATSDFMVVLRRALEIGARHSSDLGAQVEDALIETEIEAARLAVPPEGLLDCLEALRRSGREVVLIGYNSTVAIREFVDRHRLGDLITDVVGRDANGVALWMPIRHPLLLALERLDNPDPDAGVMISDTAADVATATAAGLPSIGFARGTGDAATLAEAGAAAVVTDLRRIADAVAPPQLQRELAEFADRGIRNPFRVPTGPGCAGWSGCGGRRLRPSITPPRWPRLRRCPCAPTTMSRMRMGTASGRGA